MAQTSAPTEPNTLEAALSDHAQRTLGACHSSRRFRPVGNGMPMTKPSGAINATVRAILRDQGSQTSEESSEDTTMASSAVSRAIRPRALIRRPSSRPSRRVLAKLPMPLDTDRKSTRLNSSHLGISYAVFCLRSEEHTSELQSLRHLVCRLLLENSRVHI